MNDANSGTTIKDSDIYKTFTIFLSGVLVSIVGAYFASAHDVVTKADLPGLMRQYNPYENDSKDIKAKLEELAEHQAEQGAQLMQLQVDTGRISERVGVPAHPSGDTKH